MKFTFKPTRQAMKDSAGVLLIALLAGVAAYLYVQIEMNTAASSTALTKELGLEARIAAIEKEGLDARVEALERLARAQAQPAEAGAAEK